MGIPLRIINLQLSRKSTFAERPWPVGSWVGSPIIVIKSDCRWRVIRVGVLIAHRLILRGGCFRHSFGGAKISVSSTDCVLYTPMNEGSAVLHLVSWDLSPLSRVSLPQHLFACDDGRQWWFEVAGPRGRKRCPGERPISVLKILKNRFAVPRIPHLRDRICRDIPRMRV